MRRSKEEFRKLLAEVMAHYPKRPPTPTYQKVLFWIVMLATLYVVIEVVLSSR